MFNYFVICIIIHQVLSQQLIGQYLNGNTYTQEFKNSQWNNNLDFAIYGWFKIYSFPSSFWQVGFHFTCFAPNVWTDKYQYGDRLLTFHTDAHVLENHTYTTYQPAPTPNIWQDTPFSSSDFNQWIFIYLSYGSQQQAQYVYYKFPSREQGQKMLNIIHNPSNYYFIYVGNTVAPYVSFSGQICGLYLIAGSNAYRESGFDQFQTLQTSDAFQLYIQICDQSGSVQVFEPCDIQISSKTLPNLNQSYNQTTQQSFQVKVKKYEIPFNTAFDLQVKLQFLIKINQLKGLQPNITISSNPIILPQIDQVKSNSSRRFLSSSSLNQNSTYIYTFQNVNKSQNKLTCLQKQQNLWSSSNCQILNSTEMNGFYCYCKDKTPTTITDDLEQLIQNKNLQTAFSSQGFNNLSNFKECYKYAAFWTLSFVTLLSAGLFYYGRRLDNKFIFYSVQGQTTAIDNNQSPIITQKRVKNNLENIDENNTNREENLSDNQQQQQANQNQYLQQNIDSEQQIINRLKVESKIQYQEAPYLTPINTQNMQLIEQSKQKNQEIQNSEDDMQILNLDQQDKISDNFQNQQKNQSQKQSEQQVDFSDQAKQHIKQQDDLSIQSNQLNQQYELQLQKLQNQIGTLETITKIISQPFSTLNIQQNNYYTTQNNIQQGDNRQIYIQNNFQENSNQMQIISQNNQEIQAFQFNDKQLNLDQEEIKIQNKNAENSFDQNLKDETEKGNQTQIQQKQLNDQKDNNQDDIKVKLN
ncbi:hypothetical protein ABPG74_008202 [Tetrahymena malaccensis]